MPNRLASETSPYLQQHADNPVDWYPWGDDAFARAKAEDKPILLSIGYSACHWCHVMAHESFEDEETARLMNERYVSIKVDREEMPDVDQIYQHALQLAGEHGGWPLTMILRPDGTPFFGGTYFPKADRFGRPAFKRLLVGLADTYAERRGEVDRVAGEYRNGLARIFAPAGGTSPEDETSDEPSDEPDEPSHGPDDEGSKAGAPLLPDAVDRAALRLAMHLDPTWGGFQGAPKFPNPKALELVLRGHRRARRANDEDAPRMLELLHRTLVKMAEGGIYDHLGGGFARYSTDEKWLVPHFEKMLYDNGQLLTLYAELYQVTGDSRLAQVMRETAGWLERDMRAPEGGLYTARDADSEGVEGKYYVWTPEELGRILGPADAELFGRVYDVRPGGNWNDPHGHGPRGASLVHLVEPTNDEDEARRLEGARGKLLEARRKRVPPGLDDKVLASCNGLAIAGLAEAGRVLEDASLIDGARRTATFVLERMRDGRTGRLQRTYKRGVARFPGTLDDHAFVADGLIALYEATGEPRWLEAAYDLTRLALELFYDAGQKAFFLTAASDPGLIQRPTSVNDGAVPSGMSVLLECLIRLGAVAGERRFGEVAEETLRTFHDRALKNPFGYSNLLCAMDLLQEGPAELVLAGDDVASFARVVARVYLPNRMIVRGKDAPALLAGLTRDKQPVDGKPTAYLCRDFTCERPETDADRLRERLA
jgi:uncharacterized protein YyaL (SSP411 family)